MVWTKIHIAFCLIVALANASCCLEGQDMRRTGPLDSDVVALGGISLDYVHDGADDNSLAQLVNNVQKGWLLGFPPKPETPSTMLIEKLACREAIPLLIEHLDDTRPTRARRIDGDRRIVVPLGYLCLDLLVSMSPDHSLIYAYTDKQPPELVVREGFGFPPDVLARPDAAQIMSRTKQAWARLQADGELRFHYGYGYWRQ